MRTEGRSLRKRSVASCDPSPPMVMLLICCASVFQRKPPGAWLGGQSLDATRNGAQRSAWVQGYEAPPISQSSPAAAPSAGLFGRAAARITTFADDDWLGREGSNLRMAESKSAALPLGYAPNAVGGPSRAAHHTDDPARQQREAFVRYILPLEGVPTVTLAARGVDGYKAVPPACGPAWARAVTLVRPVLRLPGRRVQRRRHRSERSAAW